MNIHMNRPNHNADENGESVGEIDIDKMKRYISYCKRWVRRDAMRWILADELGSANARHGCLRNRRRC
jgi:hypothetical protein